MNQNENQLMLEITKFVTDNYNGLYEIYSTQINQEETTFDNFCTMMYIAHLKNQTN